MDVPLKGCWKGSWSLHGIHGMSWSHRKSRNTHCVAFLRNHNAQCRICKGWTQSGLVEMDVPSKGCWKGSWSLQGIHGTSWSHRRSRNTHCVAFLRNRNVRCRICEGWTQSGLVEMDVPSKGCWKGSWSLQGIHGTSWSHHKSRNTHNVTFL